MNPNNNNEKKALGRGLAALLGDGSSKAQSAPIAREEKVPTQTIVNKTEIVEKIIERVVEKPSPYLLADLKDIEANPEQPRKTFNQASLEELAESIRERGLVQPIVVRKKGDKYQIVAGERRWRASQIAQLEKIPVIIRDAASGMGDDDLAAVVENIQREELNSVELAQAYDRLLKKYLFTQEQLAKKLGVSRVSLANTLRLLKLPDNVKDMIKAGTLTEGHSRALLALDDQGALQEVAQKIIDQGLTVREVETLVRMRKLGEAASEARAANAAAANEVPSAAAEVAKQEMNAIEEELRRIFGTRVIVRGGGVRGALEIYYSGEDSFRRILHQVRSLPS